MEFIPGRININMGKYDPITFFKRSLPKIVKTSVSLSVLLSIMLLEELIFNLWFRDTSCIDLSLLRYFLYWSLEYA